MTSGFRLSSQQWQAWRSGEAPSRGARGVFGLPTGATPGDVRAALAAIAARHEILRSEVKAVAGVPLQFVQERADIRWEGTWPASEVDARLLGTHPEGAALAAGWVEGDTGPALFLSVGGLHGDAATLSVIADELRRRLGAPSAMADPVQYADYAQWQYERADDAQLRGFWQRRPAQPLGRLPLESGADGRFERRDVPVAESIGASQADVLAAWALLLARHLGQPRVSLGIVDHGRSDDVADACGPYARVLPLDLHFDEDTSWRAWCDQVGQARDAALSHAEGHPGSDEGVALQVRVGAEREGDRVVATEAPFRLRLEITPRAGGALHLSLACDAGRFDLVSAEEMAAQLRQLLAAAPAGTTPLRELSLLHPRARTQALSGGSPRDVLPDAQQALLLHELIGQVVADHPDRAAVACADEVLSYAGLEMRSEALAARLVAAGAGPDRIVGVCLERSVDLIVGLLGVLKAGAAYLPLDPAYPPQRLACMLDDSGAHCVVAQASTVQRLPAVAQVLTLDDRPAGTPAAKRCRPHPDQLAYVIYTSGSTGRPKGVAITHRNAIHSTVARHRWYERPVGAYLLLSSVAFDSSVAGIFWTLTQGGWLVLPREDEHRDTAALAALVEKHRATHLLALPSLHAQLLVERERLATLSDVIVAGEACTAALVQAHHDALPQARLFNEYGPTEGTVWSVAHRTRPGEDPVPIGRPIPFIQAFVLDERLEPVPPGLAGELYIAGLALARGYLGRPELSAERFVPHPFAGGERLYRTGDRVRLRADGLLDFLGRVDQQVKVRGFRIELGEIEARLAGHPAVREAVAMVREDRPGERRVVAYVLPQGQRPGTQGLRQHLLQALPDYLVPSAFVVLDAFPLTPNGKVDRRALPQPEAEARSAHVPPRTVTESLIAAVWADVLGVERVGVHDNFFELGGHSLVATQVVSRVRRSFGIELPVRELFASPTVAGLAEAVERRRERHEAREDVPIEPVPRDQALPLSFAQQRLWFLAQLDADDASYHIPGMLTLRGALDADALARAFDAVQRRHDILRATFFAGAGGLPMLRIAAEPLARLARVVLPAGADPQAWAQQEALRPFALDRGPLLRATLLQVAPEHHALVLVMHHIVSDGWSTERLLQDWAASYAQALAGTPPALPPLAIQYADYASWQRRQLSEAVLEHELAHWRRVLGEQQPLLALPADRPRPAVLSGRGSRVRFSLSAELTRAARAFAQRHNATLFMLLEAAFAALLARVSGQSDIRVGTPVAGRDRLELEPLVGLFINTVVLRHDFSRAPGLGGLLEATRDAVLDASQHQRLPFERLVDALAPGRDLSHQPLFQAMFDMQTERYAALAALPGLQVELKAIDTPTSKFDLSLSCAPQGEAIEASFEYSTDLFERATVERLGEQYVRLLTEGLQHPGRPLIDLPLLAAQEAAELPQGPACELPIAAGFAGLFADSVRRQPQALAVDDGQSRLSYAQLLQRAQALAVPLQQAGAAQDRLVAILLPRSTDYVVAIVATLMSGAAWLPLDLGLPAARLQQMLEQARPPVMVAAPGCEAAARLCAALQEPPRVVAPSVAGVAAMPLPLCPHPDQLAYAIFTSGSTGTPKGALVTLAGMLNNLLAKIDQLGLGRADRIAQTASPCFDISVWQFLTALLCGASVHIVRDAVARDAAALLRVVNDQRLTVLQAVPSLMRGMLADPDAPREIPSLRCLLPTGEALPPALARQWFQRFPAIALLNAYGPAECADDVALWRLDAAPDVAMTHMPIGTPAANLRLHVVNESLQMQPPGVVGELAIGGIGVGRGYLHDWSLTAERFVPDPFGPPGARLYRSGDLVRQAADGVLTFLGRRDHQVKIRGYRVEPGEVEARLLQAPGVRAAAVLAQGDPARLVAYVAADAPIEAASLRRFLAERLPDYMLPSATVCLDELPLNANGKLDRARLPAPDVASAQRPADAPRSAQEAALARIWAQVLGLPSVGVHDNFFALGGDSILGIQVISKAREAGLRLSARDLFQHQTVQALAAVAEPVDAAPERAAPTGSVPLTPIQRAFFALEMPHPHHWNQSVLLTPDARLDADRVRATLAALVARHDALRLRFRRGTSTWGQHYADTEEAELLTVRDIGRAERLGPACDAVQASLDIEHGPVLRAGLFSGPGIGQRLLIAVHHLVVDGLSWRILLEDFAAAYLQLERAQALTLPARGASFQDWALQLQARADEGEFDGELDFWRQQTAPALPVDHPAGSRREGDIELHGVVLDRASTERLLQCARVRAKPDDFLLTALATVLMAWSGQPAVVVEQEGHGRPEDLDVARTVGWFTAAYPVRLAPHPAASPAGQLKQVKQALRAVPRSGIGHGVLRHLRATLPPSDAQVSLNYLGQLDASVDARLFERLETRSGQLYDPRAPRACEFDLNCYVLDGRLHVDWGYSRERYSARTVEALARRFVERLAELLEQLSAEDGADLLTTHDFPEAALDADTLDQLLEGME